jgi:Holliday junction resolvase
MNPETRIGNKLVKKLRAKKFWVLKIHGSQYQRPGIPDYLVMRDGQYLWIELKTPRGRLSPLQKAVIKEIESYGGTVLIKRDDDISDILRVAVRPGDTDEG